MSELGEPTAVPAGLLDQLLDALDDIVYVIDDRGEMVYWNDQLRATTGYTDAEIAAMDPAALMAPDDREFTPGIDGSIAQLEDRDVLLDIQTIAGKTIPHEFRGTTVEDPETGTAYRCGIARDVSERRERERELERYETIVESLSDGVYALDDDLAFTFVNDALCDLIGRPREALLGTDVREFLEPDDRESAARVRDETVAGEHETGEIEATIEQPGGEQRQLQARYRLLDEPEGGTFPGTAGVIRDVTQERRRREELDRQRSLLEGILNTIPDVVFAFDPEGEPLAEEFLLDSFGGYTNEEMAEMDPLELVPPDERDAIAGLLAQSLESDEVFSRESALLTKDGEQVPYEFRGTRLTGEDGGVRGIVGTGRDITERVERERALEQRHDELETLNRINELLLDVTRELVEAPDRRALEQAVCERLAASDLYRVAWIGEREFEGADLAFRVSAGAAEADVDDLALGAADDGTGGPAARALESGAIQVVNVDDVADDAWRSAAEARDVRSVAAVPLVHGETVYGVLAVYATRPDAFSEREQAGFRVLGETIGFVINAVKRRKLLFADRVTELEFALEAGAGVLGELAVASDAETSLSGFAEAGDRWLLYVDVETTAEDVVLDSLVGMERVGDTRVVSSGDGAVRIEVALTEAVVLDTAAAVGGSLSRATATPAGTRIVVEVPGQADVRETVELLTKTLPAADLVAQRERDRQPGPPGAPGGPLASLTDRQREVVQVAYRAGYYDWPRESTAEEIAETLDIAPSTLHAHLRKAEGALLGGALDGGQGTGGPGG